MFRNATPADIPLINELAHKIWPDTYRLILAPDQLNYMLELIYSETALQKQMKQGQQFVIASTNATPLGFAAYSLVDETRLIYKLHKIYILHAAQGTGLGKKLLLHVIDAVKQLGGKTLTLNVNRHNKAKDFYIKLGFVVVEEVDVPIGNNYFMNDFIMQKSLTEN